jgi:hypothetical protein
MLPSHHAVPIPGTFSSGCHVTSFCMAIVQRDGGDTRVETMLWCVVRRKDAAPCKSPSLCGGRAQGHPFSTSVSISPTSLLRQCHQSSAQLTRSVLWVDRTSDGLTVLERRAPWPCVLPPRKSWSVPRQEYNSTCHATVPPTTTSTGCGLHVAANRRYTSQDS